MRDPATASPPVLTAPTSSLTLTVTGAIPVITLVDLMLRPSGSIAVLAAVLALFLLLNATQVSAGVLRTSVLLGSLTLLLLPGLDEPWMALQQGVRIGALIASLLVSVNLLSRAAGRTTRVRDVLRTLQQSPHPSRYWRLSLASQFFGGLLGLAGIAMMMEAAAQHDRDDAREQLSSFCAIARGYSALSLWSPLYSNMSIVLGLYAGTSWTGMLPMALGVTALFIVLGTAMDRLGRRGREATADTVDTPDVAARDIWRSGAPIVVTMLCFMAVLVALSHGLQWPITAVIITVTPLGAWVVNACIGQHGSKGLGTGARMVWADMAGFRSMTSEVLMFLASGCAGTVIASAIPDAWTAQIGAWVAGAPVLACLTLSALIVALCAAAIHPMLCAVIVGTSLTPTTLGLPLPVHLTALLVGWGLAITITPFSVLSLMASRWSGVPVLTISLRANGGFVLLALLVSSVLLGTLATWIHA
jgi:hypothetical protein